MASAHSHRNSMSNLEPPPGALDKAERRRPHRVPPPPAPIDIPEPVDVRRSARRPPSPLRNSYIPDDDSDEGSQDGSDVQDDEDRPWSRHSGSPSPSITRIASSFAHRVGALVGSAGSRDSKHLPSQAELEAEAERERERSRREAEVILRREAEERKLVEDGVFAMLENSSHNQGLPPPPPRSQTMASNPSSTSSSPKEKDSWFAAVKNKLTPTKEPLTPAQQIIHETRVKEKEKKKSKEKEPNEWPSTPSRKYSDPGYLNLVNTVSPEPVTPPRPAAQNGLMTPSPGRSVDSSRDAPPLYAQFNSQGILDVPDTLLTVARRFEKLERWTVSHVRALEDRMGDVERWLVEKEKEKEKEDAEAAVRGATSEKSSFHSDDDEDNGRENDLAEIREELMELQGRMGELGREMAKLMTAPPNLNSGPGRNAAVSHSKYTSHTASTVATGPAAAPAPAPILAPSSAPAVPPTPSSIGPRSLPTVPASIPRTMTPVSTRPRETTSPPTAQRSSSVLSTGSGRTRLPYPTGDYTSPPGSIPTKQDILSPTSSPPSSLTEATRRRPSSISGLPSGSASLFQSSQTSGTSTPGLPPRQAESPIRALSPNSNASDGRSPTSGNQRHVNVSPTPRKRYTVPLGQPISSTSTAEESEDYNGRQRMSLMASPVSGDDDDDYRASNSEDSEDGGAEAHTPGHSREDTVGKSGIRLVNPPSMPNDTLRHGNSTTISPKNSPGSSRVRAQSSYGPPRGFNINMLSAGSSPNTSPSPIAPLRPRVRSKSIDPIGLGISVSNGNGRFVDPLELRKQEQEPKTPKTPKYERGKKVPVNELVAFFDKETQR